MLCFIDIICATKISHCFFIKNKWCWFNLLLLNVKLFKTISMMFFVLMYSYDLCAQADSLKKLISGLKGLQISYIQGHYGEFGIMYALGGENTERHYSVGYQYVGLTYQPYNNQPILGLKAGFTGGMSPLGVGLNIVSYTNFNKFSLVFLPEIGVHNVIFKLMYGYQSHLINKNALPTNRHQITFGYYLLWQKDRK